MKKLSCLLLLLLQLMTATAWAEHAFVVKDIQVLGLENVTPATVESYIPIKRGQTLQPSKTANILRELYKTNFFDRITLERKGNTLIIHVIERPTIGQLKITGNSIIPTDKLKSVMTSMDIAEGRVYNPAVLEKIQTGLLSQYYQLGHYNAHVDIYTSSMSRNRVAVKIVISEGLVAKIRRISIIGNHAFSEKTLVKQLDISTTGLFTFFTQTDRYSEQKLDASLDKLRGYYMDHGYLRFEIKSAQAQVTPDRKSVYITVVVAEGDLYHISGYSLQGNLILPRAQLESQIQIKPGELFSRQKVIDSEKAITKMLGNQGYLFANISLHPQINETTHQVWVLFIISPGKRVYVRHITFSQNTRTNDVVLRREIEQMEAAPASSTKLDNSKHHLSMLPYIKSVDMNVNPVPEADDQVDVNYKVEEESAASASLKVGYSPVYGLILGAGLDQKDFLGTGNTLGLDLSHSQYEQYYGINYTNPYYTEDGISRSFNFAISRVNPAGANLNVGYTTNEYDAGVLYSIPIGQEEGVTNRVQAGLAYRNTLVNLTTQIPNQVLSFVNDHGRRFQEADFTAGYSRDSRDKAVFPTKGMLQTIYLDLFAPLDHNSVAFYQANYHGQWYEPLNESYIISTRADLGYGNGLHGASNYPFFKNFYAGGITSVRGFYDYSLGPRDSKGNPFGGNMLADASLGLIFPNYISDNLRTTTFVDAGNVYSSLDNHSFGGESTNTGPIRYSVGVEADWTTPFGPIALSLAKPFLRKHDESRAFQFALGANF